MKRKILIFALVGVLLLGTMLSMASASEHSRKASANGAGVFIHEHEGLPHTHYFAFSVSQGYSKYSPKNTFNLICKHDGQIVTIIVSTTITSFSVERVQGGLKAVFAGSALVKMNNTAWEKGWVFTVTAYDLDPKGVDSIGIILINPQGQVHCTVDPTPLTSGNIVIRK